MNSFKEGNNSKAAIGVSAAKWRFVRAFRVGALCSERHTPQTSRSKIMRRRC